MGLDMWVYKARKLTDAELKQIKGLEASKISEVIENAHCITISDLTEEDKILLRDLLPFCRKTTAVCSYWDIDKMKEYLDIIPDAEAYVSYMSYRNNGTTIGLSYTNPDGTYGDKKLGTINEEEFLIKKEEEVYVVILEEIAYWRKYYDLQEALYDAYFAGIGNQIQNCGYHRINKDMMKVIRRYDEKEQLKGIRLTNNLFYHEWY